MTDIRQIALDTLKSGAPGLSEQTREVLAGIIARKASLIRPAPVASGGQHSSGEEVAWTWLNGHVECDPADRDYSADEMVDAFMAGAGRYDRWAKALERIAGEHQHRSGYCQTDITVEPALTTEEAQAVARDALSGTPVHSEAPVAETAGEAVVGWAYETEQRKGVRERHVILNRPDGKANPPTKHHGVPVYNVRTLYAAPVPAQDDDKLRIAASALLDACVKDFGDPADFEGDDGSVARSKSGGCAVTFKHMRDLNLALTAAQEGDNA